MWTTGDFEPHTYVIDSTMLPPSMIAALSEVDISEGAYSVSYLPPGIVMTHGLPPGSVIGFLPSKDSEMTSIHISTAFRLRIHEIAAADRPPGLVAEAKRQENGAVAMIDQRNEDPMGEVPSADIIGFYWVSEGRITKYEPNSHYEFISSAGLFKLTPSIRAELRSRVLEVPAGQ